MLVRRECSLGLYGPLPLALARGLVGAPVIALRCVLFGLSYWMAGLRYAAAPYFRYLVSCWCMNFTARARMPRGRAASRSWAAVQPDGWLCLQRLYGHTCAARVLRSMPTLLQRCDPGVPPVPSIHVLLLPALFVRTEFLGTSIAVITPSPIAAAAVNAAVIVLLVSGQQANGCGRRGGAPAC